MGKTILVETLRHQEAFQFYYALGHERSFGKVAREFGVSDISVGKWAKSFNWTERVTRRDAEIAEAIDAQVTQEIIDQRPRIERILDLLISNCLTTDKDGKTAPTFRVSSAADFERVVKLYLLMHGEPTERWEEISARADAAREKILSRFDAISATREAERIVGGNG